MISVNRVILTGRLGADPEKKSFSNGGQVVNLRVATSESWKDKRSGERMEKTEWHQVAIFNEQKGDFVSQYARKGDAVYIEGKIQTRKYEDKDGQERYATEIIVPAFGGDVQLQSAEKRDNNGGGGRGNEDRGGRGGRDDDRGGGRGSDRGRGGRDDDRGGRGNYGGGRLSDAIDDDIPF